MPTILATFVPLYPVVSLGTFSTVRVCERVVGEPMGMTCLDRDDIGVTTPLKEGQTLPAEHRPVKGQPITGSTLRAEARAVRTTAATSGVVSRL
jgi:hypothetical protein